MPGLYQALQLHVREVGAVGGISPPLIAALKNNKLPVAVEIQLFFSRKPADSMALFTSDNTIPKKTFKIKFPVRRADLTFHWGLVDTTPAARRPP